MFFKGSDLIGIQMTVKYTSILETLIFYVVVFQPNILNIYIEYNTLLVSLQPFTI